MLPTSADPDVLNKLAALRNGGVKTVPVGDVGEIVEGILDSMNGDLSTIDQTLFGELESLSAFIHASKGEIGPIRPESIRETHIPAARDELDAVVGATERATDDIMSAAEKIQAIGETLDDESADELTNQVMLIYEACGFQDITGQRIAKVVNTLQKIEANVDSMLAVFGGDATGARVETMAQDECKADMDDELMHGPQLEGSGNTQDEIDKLLASFD